MTMTSELCPDGQLAAATALAGGGGQAGYAEVERLCASYPKDPRLHFLLGSLAAGERNYEDARRSMATAVAIAPEFSIARFQLGLLMLTSGEGADASDMLRPLLELDRDDPLHLFAEGLLHLIRDEFALAISSLERGIESNHANLPLNRDMRMLVDEILGKTGPEQQTIAAPHSAAHDLLRQSALKATKH